MAVGDHPPAMKVNDEYVPEELFAEFVASMPQVCVELVVEHDGGVLLARRTNEPAGGEWFWPGSRLYKGERPVEAVHRIAGEELGIGVELGERLGVYSHFWESSSLSGSPSRHTVNLVYRVAPADADPDVTLDDQHEDWRVVTERESGLHEYVRRYVEDHDLL
jgi:colanic acid biosynthesis protein WcaH